MDYTQPQFWPQLKTLAVNIDGMDYFQILNLAQDAQAGHIKQTYYGMARALHPDKFFHIEDAELTAAISKIYKRITEAYTILKDDVKRARYTAGINGPKRDALLRYSEQSEQEEAREKREARDVAKTPQGKKMYQAAVAEMNKGNWNEAYKHIQSAMLFEMGNTALSELKAELDQKRKENA